MLGEGIIHVHSSGSQPSGIVNEKAIASMKAIEYDLTDHSSKSLNDIPHITYDYVVTMGCGDECQNIKTTTVRTGLSLIQKTWRWTDSMKLGIQLKKMLFI